MLQVLRLKNARRPASRAGGNRHPLRQSVPLPWRRRAALHSGIERRWRACCAVIVGAGRPVRVSLEGGCGL